MIASRHDQLHVGDMLTSEVPVHGAAAESMRYLAQLLLCGNKFEAHALSSAELAALIPDIFVHLRDNGLATFEFIETWEGIVDRLSSSWLSYHGGETIQAPSDFILQCVRIMASLEELRRVLISSSFFRRLAVCRSTLSRFRDIHTEIDQLQEADDGFSKNRCARGNWRFAIRKQEDAVFGAFLLRSRSSDEELRLYLKDEFEAAEVTSCLDQESSFHADKCRPKLLEALKLALFRVRQLTEIEVAVLPPWFLTSHELVQEQSHATVSPDEQVPTRVLQGKWSGSEVAILRSTLPREEFVKVVEKWSQLNHPNVVRLFGASHFCHPSVAVFEEISYSSLRDYLRAETRRHSLVWQKLYEVALGLKYLHERGVVLGAFKLDSIWIGADQVAKIAAFREVLWVGDELQRESEEDSWCWRSPEVLQSNSPTFASDVCSFGKCVQEAMTIQMASSDLQVIARSSPLTTQERELFTPTQRQLVDEMCSPDPLQRSSLVHVIENLKKWSEGRLIRNQSNEPEDTLRVYTPADLRGSTIEEFLVNLKSRLAFCTEQREPMSQVLDRLMDISSHLHKTEISPDHVAVKRFCGILREVNRFLDISIGATRASVRVRRDMSKIVSSDNDLHHKQIDEVLDLLPNMIANDRLHNWTGLPKANTKMTFSEGGITLTYYKSTIVNTKLNIGELSLMEKWQQTPWQIRLHDLAFDEMDIIGYGTFAGVYRGRWLGTRVVVKHRGYEENPSAFTRKMFLHVLRIWYPLNHPHVTKLLGACDRGQLLFVCEDASLGDLANFLKQDSNYSCSMWQKLHEIALGLQYLHKLNIVHNDLKCSNFLVGADNKAKISGFGFGSILYRAEVLIDPKRQGAENWRSPEYLRGERPTQESDIYSFGMCILEAVTGQPPWSTMSGVHVRFQLQTKRFPLRPASMTDSQWSLILMMGAHDPVRRVTIATVVDILHVFAQDERVASCETPVAF